MCRPLTCNICHACCRYCLPQLGVWHHLRLWKSATRGALPTNHTSSGGRWRQDVLHGRDDARAYLADAERARPRLHHRAVRHHPDRTPILTPLRDEGAGVEQPRPRHNADWLRSRFTRTLTGRSSRSGWINSIGAALSLSIVSTSLPLHFAHSSFTIAAAGTSNSTAYRPR